MLSANSPLHEKMVLFWHGHFTSSLKKVKWPPALLKQNLLFRQHAMGSFRDLLAGVLKDPAMLIYLDNANSRRQAPNENLARELLELFTLGEGNYAEEDIKALAQSLTGASVNRRTGEYQYRRRFHDTSVKTLFGETGDFGPDDVVDLILKQPQVGSFMTNQLWQYFVGTPISESALQAVSQAFVEDGFQISTLLVELFKRDEFWQASGQQMKSPMDLIVGTSNLLGANSLGEQQFIRLSRGMQQDLFDPPNVKGWPGGDAWYSSVSLVPRELFCQKISRRVSSVTLPQIEQLLAIQAMSDLPDPDSERYLPSVLSDPAYQVQ